MRNIFTIILLVIGFTSTAQQLPQYSLYMFNEGIINPASLCAKTHNQVSLMVRDQWTGFQGAPKTQSISYYNLNHHKYKRGLNIINDITGPISTLQASLTGSYTIPINDNNKFAVGATASILQYKIDNNDIVLEDDGIPDPAMQGGVEKVVGHSVNLGLHYYNTGFFLGLSVPNIIGSNLDISNEEENNSLEQHYFLNGGVYYDIGTNYQLIPSVMLKKIGATPVQMDLNLRAIYDRFLWAGVSYRTQDAISMLFGLDYANYSFGYSYDFTTSTMKIPSAGSHGLLASYKFKVVEKDRDKDGIVDSKDDCPEVKGLPEFNGCPDTDLDGIMDSKDDCIEEPGLPINNGCPDIDNDSIIDKHDRCPEEPGLKINSGCPDSDGDGIIDKIDNCPTVRGVPKYIGCPDTLFININDTVLVPIKKEVVVYDTVQVEKPITVYDTVTSIKKEVKESTLTELYPVYFALDKSDLDDKAKAILDDLAKYLKNDAPKLKLLIHGHTDATGSDKYNAKLGKRRAIAVMRYLYKKGGISKKRLGTKSFGEKALKEMGWSQKAHSLNRRVEFIPVQR